MRVPRRSWLLISTSWRHRGRVIIWLRFAHRLRSLFPLETGCFSFLSAETPMMNKRVRVKAPEDCVKRSTRRRKNTVSPLQGLGSRPQSPRERRWDELARHLLSLFRAVSQSFFPKPPSWSPPHVKTHRARAQGRILMSRAGCWRSVGPMEPGTRGIGIPSLAGAAAWSPASRADLPRKQHPAGSTTQYSSPCGRSEWPSHVPR